MMVNVFNSTLWILVQITASFGTTGSRDVLVDLFNTGKAEWRLAFRASAGLNVSAYGAYMKQHLTPSAVPHACYTADPMEKCPHHVRVSEVLDHWGNIDEVALVLYSKGWDMKSVVFDGRGSTWLDWFSVGRVKLSSWPDLKTTLKNYFSIQGDYINARHFFMSSHYGGCPSDVGWIVAVDKLNPPCGWERKYGGVGFPKFLYAGGDRVTNWTTGKVGLADELRVYVKYLDATVVGK